MKLFHGTSAENHQQIQISGKLIAPVFLTPSKSSAAEYAGKGGVVIEVSVNADMLGVDFDLPGALVLSVSEANEYDGTERSIYDYIADGQSVAAMSDITI